MNICAPISNHRLKQSIPNRPESGFALVTAMIFLVLLTLVALAAIRGSGLEGKASSNNALHTKEFETSEFSRSLVEQLLTANVSYGGWPKSIGGNVDAFDAASTSLLDTSGSCTSGFCITTSGGAPRDWRIGNSECTAADPTTCAAFSPSSLDQDATYINSISSSVAGGQAITTASQLYIYKLYTALAPGSGTQMVSGYIGTGRSAAAGGTNAFFYIASRGHGSNDISSPQTPSLTNVYPSSQTSAVYRVLITN